MKPLFLADSTQKRIELNEAIKSLSDAKPVKKKAEFSPLKQEATSDYTTKKPD